MHGVFYHSCIDHWGVHNDCCTSLFLQALTTAREKREENMQLGEDTHAPSVPVFDIKLNRKFEPSEMSEVFFGRCVKIIYIVVLSLYIFMAAWSFTTVAGSAWASISLLTRVLCTGVSLMTSTRCYFLWSQAVLMHTGCVCFSSV